MPNYRNVHPYALVVDNPPTTCEPGSVYEFAQVLDADGNVVSPNPNFFEETSDPVTVEDEPADEAPVEPPAPVKPPKGARSAPSPSDDTPAPESTTEPEETV